MPKAVKKAPKDTQNDKNARCTWSSSDDSILVHTLREQKDAGNQSGAEWKSQVWHAVSEAIKAESMSKGAPKVAKKCSDHWANLKKNFLEVSAIRYSSGFGWDEGTQTCTATEGVWEKYIKAHPNAERWRSTPFPLFDDISYLVNGIVATGAGAFHPGRSISPTETVSSEEQAHENPSVYGESLESTATQGVLNDSLSDEIADSSDDPKDISQSSSRKRSRADSELPDSPKTSSPISEKKKKAKRRRITSANQNDDRDAALAGAIFQLSKSMNNGNGAPTPERREKAIDLLSDDKAFSLDEEGDLLELFADNIAYADTYLATKKKESRVLFANRILSRRRRQLEGSEN